MAGFRYEALDDAGRVQRGVLEVDSPRQARRMLRERGLWTLSVDALTASKTAPRSRVWRGQAGEFNGGGLVLDGLLLSASAGGYDTHIAKLDQSGSGLWVRAVTGAMDQFSAGAAPDAMGDAFFGINTSGDVAVGGGEALTGLGSDDFLLGRLAP